MALTDMIPSQFKAGALVTAILTVAAVTGWLLVSRANLRADLATARAQNIAALAANGELAARLTATEKTFEDLQQAAKDREKAALEAVRAAEGRAQTYKDKAASLARKTDPSGPDACAGVQTLIDDYLRGMR